MNILHIPCFDPGAYDDETWGLGGVVSMSDSMDSKARWF